MDKTYPHRSAEVFEIKALAYFHPHLRTTNSVYEEVTIGYRAQIEQQYTEDSLPFYDSREFKTEKEARTWIKQQ